MALLVALLFATQVFGIDYLGVQRFDEAQCKTALSGFNGLKVLSLGFLWRSFGPNLSCIERFLARQGDKPHLLRIHATNETCVRGGRHCTRWDRPKNVQVRFRAINRWLLKQPLTIGLVTIGLEDSFSLSEVRRRQRLARKIISTALIGRNRYAGSTYISGFDFVELHSVKNIARRRPDGIPCIFSNDGTDIDFNISNGRSENGISLSVLSRILRKAGKSCDLNFAWWNSQGGDKPGVEPYKRDVRISSQDVSSINFLIRRLEYEHYSDVVSN